MVLTKVFLFSVKTLTVSLIQIDILYVQLISNSTLNTTSPDCTVFTQSKWHIIHQLRKGEDGHMHNFLPIHWFIPPCQSPWNSTKKTQQTEWQDCFFLTFTLILRVRGSTKVLFHVATFSSLQDTLPQTLPSSSLPHPRPHTGYMIVKGAGRMLKTRWRQKGSRLFELSLLSSL